MVHIMNFGMNKYAIGVVGELKAAQALREKGYNITLMARSSPYDLLAQRDDLKLLVQVKYGKTFVIPDRNINNLLSLAESLNATPILMFVKGNDYVLLDISEKRWHGIPEEIRKFWYEKPQESKIIIKPKKPHSKKIPALEEAKVKRIPRETGRPSLCPTLIAAIHEARKAGLSYREIEDEYGVSKTSAWRYTKHVKIR